MPDLSKSKVESPLHTYTGASQNARGDYYGSKDTLLGRFVGGNYYDEGLTSYDNQQAERYANQGPLNAVGNFFANLGVKTLNGIPAVVGRTMGIVYGTGTAITGGRFTDGFDDNPFMNFSKAMSTWGDEHFPQMYEPGFEEESFSKKLFSDTGQLITSNVSTLGFLAQSFGLAGLLSKANVGARVVLAMAKGKNYAAALSELGAQDLASIASKVDEVTMNAFLTTNESAMEGQDAYDQMREQLHQQRLLGQNNLSDEEIDDSARNAMGNVFWSNMAVLGLTNGFFTKLVKPLFSPASVSTRMNRLGLKTLAGTDSFVEAANKNMNKFEKFLFDKGNVAGMVSKSLLEQAVSEGLEEDIQYSIQKMNDIEHQHLSLKDSALATAKDLLLHGLDFSDDKRLESTALGSLVGAGSTAVASVAGFGPAKEARDFRDEQEKTIQRLNSTYTDFFNASVAEKELDKKGKLYTQKTGDTEKYFNEIDGKADEVSPETYFQLKKEHAPDTDGNYVIKGKYRVDSNGNLLKDPVKSAKFAADYRTQNEYDDLLDAEATKNVPDDIKVKLFQLSKLSSLAKAAFDSGNADALIQKLESYRSASAQEQGGLGPEKADDLINGYVDHVKRLEKAYQGVMNDIVVPVTSKLDNELLSKMRDYAYSVAARTVTLDHLIQRAQTNLQESIRYAGAEGAAVAASLETDTPIDLQAKTEYPDDEFLAIVARDVARKKELVNAREQLGAVYTKLLSPRKGFQTFKKAALSGDYSELRTTKDLSKTIKLNDSTTSEDLGRYEKRNVDTLRHAERMRYASTAFFSDAINNLIKFSDGDDHSKDSAQSVRDLVGTIADRKLDVYPDQADKLIGLIDAITAKVANGKQDIQTKLGALDYSSVESAEFDGYDDPVATALVDEFYALDETAQALGDPEALKAKIEKAKGFPTLTVDETSLRKAALEQLLVSPQSALDAYDIEGENYDDLERVLQDLSDLTHLERILTDDPVHAGIKAKVKSLRQRLEKVAKEVEKNRLNRELKNKKQDEHYASGVLRVLDVTSALPTDHTAKFAVLKNVDPVTASKVALYFLSKQSSEEQQTLFELYAKKLRTAIDSLGVFTIPTVPAVAITDDEVEAIMANPTKAFALIFQKLLRKEQLTGTEDASPLEDYDKDYDVVKLLSSLNKFKGTTTPAQIKELLELQAELTAIYQVGLVDGAAFNEVQFLDKLVAALDKLPVVPSSSQIRAVRELSLFLSGGMEEGRELFMNGASLKAPAGAGKSLVIAKLLKATAEIKDDEVLTAAPLAKAAKNISDSMGSTKGPHTVATLTDDLLNGRVDKKTKLIVVDEAGALTIKEIYDFGVAFAQYTQKNPQHKIKFVFLYDPAQVTPGSFSALDMRPFSEVSLVHDDYYKDPSTKAAYRNGQTRVKDFPAVPFIQNLYQISPLSTVYRTDVSEVVDLQNNFKKGSKVESVTSSASQDPKKNTKDIMGSYAEGGNSIIETYTSSEASNPGRSRVIVVGNENKKSHYQSVLPKAEVLTVEEAQGITVDEVYVDVAYADQSNFSTDPGIYNRYMYTATSRASQYVHVAGLDSSFKVNPDIPTRVEDIRKRKTSDNTALKDQLKTESATIKEFTNQTTVPAAAPIDVEEEVVEEASEEETSTADEPEETPLIPVTEAQDVVGEHKLWHPTSEVFDEDKVLPQLKPGEKLLVVKDTTQKEVGVPQQRFVVLQKLEGEGSVFGYRIVAVLNQNEVSDVAKLLNADLEELEPYVFRELSSVGKGVIYPVDGEITSFHEVYNSNKSHDIGYVYSNKTTYSFAQDSDDEGKLQALSILEPYFKSMFGPNPAEVVENYEDILENFENYTKIVAFKNDKERRLLFPNAKSDKHRPKKNVPYLIIDGVKMKNGGKMAPQFIRLTPTILNMKAAPKLGIDTDAIVTVLDRLTRFEQMTANLQLPGKYGQMKNGMSFTIGTTQNYYPFHYYITQLSKAYMALEKGESLPIQMTKFPHIQEVFPEFEASTLPKEYLALAHEIDVLVHGEVKDDERRQYKGKAQKALDAIGSQNLIITLPNGKNVLMRDYRHSYLNRETGKEATDISGFSLLGPLRFAADKGLAYTPYIKDRLVKALTKYKNALDGRGEFDSPRARFLQQILKDPKSSHLIPITTEDLSDIFLRGQDAAGNLSNLSEGFGIRTPMLSGAFRPEYYNTGTIKELAVGGLFDTTFEKVVPTQIVISTAPDGAQAAPIMEKTERILNPLDALRRAIRTGKPLSSFAEETKEEFTAFMEASSFDEAVALYKANTTQLASWQSKTKNIYQGLKLFRAELEERHYPTVQQARKDIEESIDIIGVGKGAGKTSARDFIRGVALLRMFPLTTSDGLYEISDLARTYFKVGKDDIAFEASLANFAERTGQDLNGAYTRLRQMLESYATLSGEELSDVVVDGMSALEMMQTIVDLSSQIRSSMRSSQAAPITDERYQEFVRTLAASLENEEDFEDVLNNPQNADLKTQLESSLSEGQDIVDKVLELASDDEVERSRLFVSETEQIGEELSTEEAEELIRSMSPTSALGFFKKLFSKSKGERLLRIVEFNSLQNSKGERVWGLYKNGLIEIARSKKGRIGADVVRHEFFHKVFWEYLSPAEQAYVLGLAKEKWGKMSSEQLEERLAEEFSTYRQTKKSFLARVWDKMLELIGFSTRHFNSIEQLFDLIHNRRITPKGRVRSIERSMLPIASGFDTLDQFKLAKTLLLSTFSSLEKERRKDGVVKSFAELVATTFAHLEELKKDVATYMPTVSAEEQKAVVEALKKLLDVPKTKQAFVDDYFGQIVARAAALNLWSEDQQRRLDAAAEEKQLLQDRLADGEDVQDQIDELENLEKGIANETFDSELRDPKIKVTGNVKQRLVSIRYSKNGVETYAEFGKVFGVLLNKVSSIPTSSLATTLDALQEEFRLFRGIPNKLKPTIREATGKFMLDLVENLKFQLGPNSTIVKSVSYRKDVNYEQHYAIVSLDGSSTHGVSRRQAELEPSRYKIIPQDAGMSVDTFVTRVAAEGQVTKQAAANAYYFFEDLDFIKSLTAAVASLRENKPHIAQARWEYGRFKAAYFRSKTGGGSAVLESKVFSLFDSYVRGLVSDNLFPKDMVSNFLSAENVTKKREALKAFLRVVGIKSKVQALDTAMDEDIERVFSRAAEAIPSMQEAFTGSDKARTATALLSDETSFVGELVGLLNTHYELAETNSYIRGDGKKAYGFIDESYQSSALTSIVRSLAGKMSRTYNTFGVKDGKLTTKDRFLARNIFFTGISQIKSFIDHDSIKTKGNERFAKYLRKETAAHFDQRHITFGFFSRLRSSKSGFYYQFLPIPSNRTTIQAVEVKALKEKELEKAYRSVIQAQKNRPSPEANPDLAAVAGYSQRYQDWKLAGLEGKTTNMTEEQALKAIYANAETKAKAIAQQFMMSAWGTKPPIPLDDRDINNAIRHFDLGADLPVVSSRSEDSAKAAYVKRRNEAVEQILRLFYLNFGINNYSLSQLLYGDEVFYGTKETQTKRIQIVTATGDTLLVDSNYGLPPTSKILVVKDAKRRVPKELENAGVSTYRDTYDASDAEGYMLPEFYEKVASAYGIESLTDVVLKPVYFNIVNGVPQAVKYSVKVLTDEIVAKDPVLKQFRDEMRRVGADQLTFKSAVKVGAPASIAALNDNDFLKTDTVHAGALMELDNNYLRFQLNPAKTPEVTTANPSQGTAFIDTNGRNTTEAAELHRLNALVIENKLRGVFRELKLTAKGGLTGKSVKELKKRLASTLEGVPGSRDIYNLLSFKGKDKVSLSLPLIADRVVATLSSIMTSSTTGFRFKGSKLVLQAELGKRDVINSDGTKEHRYLKFRDAQGFCEVILPRSYETFMKAGDKFIPGNDNGMVGFRIPSTNYHSLLPLKVVGFYDAPKGAKANVVIAPSAIVYFHGSD